MKRHKAKLRIDTTPEAVDAWLEDLGKVYRLSRISKVYDNEENRMVRVYVTIELKRVQPNIGIK